MKIFISTDIEGIAGIVDFDMEHDDSEIFRDLYNQQVEWVLEGIQQSSKNDEIDEIVIADSHAKGNNLSYNRLSNCDERISLINGWPRPEYMMSTLDKSFDQIFFVGYHSGIGKQAGNMDHGYSARVAYKIWINELYQNETTINAAYAAEIGVPVTLIVGDSGLREQLIEEKMFPQVKFVETKKSLSRYAAWSYSRKKVREDTISAVKEVLADTEEETKLLKYKTPTELKMQVYTTAQADTIAQLPAVKRLDGRTISAHVDSMHDALNTILAMVALGGTQN